MLAGYNSFMRTFSFLFTFISLVMLTMFLVYVIRGPVDPVIATGLFISFLFCAVPTLFLLKPFESREALQGRREERARREKSKDDEPPAGSGS